MTAVDKVVMLKVDHQVTGCENLDRL